MAHVINDSCNTSDKMKHEKEVGKLNYHVKFNKVDKQFIQSKKQKALNFYNDYLGSDRFNGMFLVAKNVKILLEKYSCVNLTTLGLPNAQVNR